MAEKQRGECLSTAVTNLHVVRFEQLVNDVQKFDEKMTDFPVTTAEGKGRVCDVAPSVRTWFCRFDSLLAVCSIPRTASHCVRRASADYPSHRRTDASCSNTAGRKKQHRNCCSIGHTTFPTGSTAFLKSHQIDFIFPLQPMTNRSPSPAAQPWCNTSLLSVGIHRSHSDIG